MAIYEVITEDGKTYEVETEDQPQEKSFVQQIPDIAKQATTTAFQSSPANLTKQIFQTDPATMQKVGGSALPIVGGSLGGPVGAIGGEALRQFTGTALAPQTVPQTAIGRAASMLGAGVVQEPTAFPGIGKVGDMATNLASKVGKGVAKFEEALTGAKAKDLEQAASQGLSTYKAPSMEKVQGIFGKAMQSAGISTKPPLKQIIDPQLSTAREVALKVGDKLEKGIDIGAGDALRARQAIDRIYSATPLLDRSTRGHLADLRTAFDDVIAGKSGALKEASTLYRQAIVKRNLLNPFRITKQGQISAVAPMVATLAATAGIGSGHKGEGGLGALGYLAASSPALAGLAAAGGGSTARAFGAIASIPQVRQALLGILQQIQSQRNQQ